MSLPYDKCIIDIVDYVFCYEVKGDRAWHFARMALLDTIGCAIETVSKSEACRRMIGPTAPGTIVPDGFRLPGTDYILDIVKGAFDMGTLIRYLDHNDALSGAEWGHPSDNIGAILAVTDYLSRASKSGRIVHTGPPLTMHTLLTALIKAYEIQGCYQMCNSFNAYGFDHVILVKLASTAVVSWLMGLSKQQTMGSVSHAWMDGHPGRVYRSGTNTIPRKGWAAADACAKAVHLSLLVKAGQPGAPTVLTDPKWGFYARNFGNNEFDLPRPFGEWAIQNIAFKIMPVEGHAISAVEAALVQRAKLAEEGLDWRDVESIAVRTTNAANVIINKKGRLYNAADRDHCIQYVIALALMKGGLPETQDYDDESPWATSQDLASLRDNINVRADTTLTEDYLNIDKKSVGAGLTLYLRGGRVTEEVLIEYPASHVVNPKTEGLQKEKFVRNMRLMFTDAEISVIENSVCDSEMDISDFVYLFVREGTGIAKL